MEPKRLHVLNTVLEYQLPVAHAAELLGVSERRAWRILAAYRRRGAAALAHNNRSRRPRNAVSDDQAAAVVQLAEQHDEWAQGRRYLTRANNLIAEKLPTSTILHAAA